MAPRKKTLAGSWRGPQLETYSAFVWNVANRRRHETDYPTRPAFTAAERADWTRIYKPVDIEHRKPGRNSFQALVGRQLAGPDGIPRTVVYFVAYMKEHGIIEIVSIRYADTHERTIFLG